MPATCVLHLLNFSFVSKSLQTFCIVALVVLVLAHQSVTVPSASGHIMNYK